MNIIHLCVTTVGRWGYGQLQLVSQHVWQVKTNPWQFKTNLYFKNNQD